MLVCLRKFISVGKLEFIALICLISAYGSVPDSSSQEQMIFSSVMHMSMICSEEMPLHVAECEQRIVHVCQH